MGMLDHLGAHEPEVEDVGPRLGRPAHDRLLHRGRGQPHVPADGDAAWLELLDVCPADRLRARLVELVRVDPAHVVRLEDLGVEHGSRSGAG